MTVRRVSYDLKKVTALRRRLAEGAVVVFSQEPCGGPELAGLVGMWNRELRCDPDVVRASLTDLLGTRLGKAELAGAAWRLAGNLSRLRAGRVVPRWSRQAAPEWVPAQFKGVLLCPRPGRDSDGTGGADGGATIVLEVQAGTPAGLEVRRWLPRRALARWRTVLGFSRPMVRPDNWPAHKPFLLYEDPRQLYRLRASLLLTPDASAQGPGFETLASTPSLRAWNLQILLRRARHEFACPVGYTHPCHRCGVGLGRCPAATHREDWEARDCPRCRREGAFDPAWPTPVCLSCAARPAPRHQ